MKEVVFNKVYYIENAVHVQFNWNTTGIPNKVLATIDFWVVINRVIKRKIWILDKI